MFIFGTLNSFTFFQENFDKENNGSAECCTGKEFDQGDIKKISDELSLVHDDFQNKDIAIREVQDHNTLTDAGVSSVSEIQNTPDSIDGWNVLLDEQTNRYYYWNTITGETSWELPNTSQGASAISM